MSRIGQKTIKIPTGITVEASGNEVLVKGSKGELSMTVHNAVSVKVEDDGGGINIEKVRSKAEEKGIELRLNIESQVPRWIIGDAMRIKQILINLVSNAIKFTQRGGEISIRLLRSGDYAWKLEVEDNGKGIPQEAQAYIFESFRQVDGSITREAHTGSGLGLSIVNHLVRLMRGEIRLESELGKGSKFIVLLPLKKNKE